MADTLIVVPCYNEAARLDTAEFLRWAGRDGLSFLFIDDGSTDGTERLLERMERRAAPAITRHRLPVNRGKAEAVRQGMLLALQAQARLTGYLDADLATPVQELLGMRQELERTGAAVVLGSRIAMLGHQIDRHWYRHYTGRVFATLASWVLGLAVYDTQCGAKLFRSSPLLEAALQEPFHSRWAFDVELLGRLLIGAKDLPGLGPHAVIEYPLHFWNDVKGSKLNAPEMVSATAGLLITARRLAKRRQALAVRP